jgi:predicted ribosomally synthesized peptide with SipW-like signal peptide
VSRKRFTSKTYLKWLILVGVLAVIGGGAGTFATFNAETTNANNTFATGSLLLNDSTATQASCFSYGSGAGGNNANPNCNAILTATNATPGTAGTGDVTISNTGTLDPSAFVLSTAGCTPTQLINHAFNTGNLCNSVLMYVQEWDSAGHANATHCWFGHATVANTCDFTRATAAADSIHTFATTYPPSSPLTLTGGLVHNTSRYFTIGLELPDTGPGANNAFQDLQASFPLTWHIDQ